MLQLSINSVVYSGFTKATATKTMQNLVGSFNFEATGGKTLQEFSEKINLFDTVEIYADKIKIMTGFVEVLDISYSSDNYTVTVSGREKTCDVVDSMISTTFTKTASTTFKQLIDSVLSKTQLSTRAQNPIKVIDKSTNSAIAFLSTDQQISGNGQTVFDFLNMYALKKYIVMITDENGDIELVNSGNDVLQYKINNKEGVKNNIWKSSITYNVSKLYNTYQYRAFPDFTNQASQTQTPQQQSNSIVYTTVPDDSVRIGREFIDIEENNFTVLKLKDRARWRMQTNIANARRYKVTLDGHTFVQSTRTNQFANFIAENTSVQPLKINQLIDVDDEIAGIDETLLVESLTYSMSENGNTLDVVLVNRFAYTLQAEDTILSNKFYGVDQQ